MDIQFQGWLDATWASKKYEGRTGCRFRLMNGAELEFRGDSFDCTKLAGVVDTSKAPAMFRVRCTVSNYDFTDAKGQRRGSVVLNLEHCEVLAQK